MCGIFGFAKTSGRQSDNQLDILKRVFEELTDESSVRGEDSTGFSIMNSEHRFTYKTLLDSSSLVSKDVWDTDILSRITRDTTIVMGHVRLATHGSVKVHNAHPFNVGDVTGVHNGIIYNYNQVAKKLGKSVPEVDSQVLFQSLNRIQMDKAFESIDGDFAITWVKDSNRKVHLARESGRPIVVAYWKKARVLLWASTKAIMQDAMIRAGLNLPIKSVPEDYIFTYDTDNFDSRPNQEQVPFDTISQYSYRNSVYGGSSWSGRNYNYYSKDSNPSPASSHLITSGSTDSGRKEICTYCYEYTPADEIWKDATGSNVCFDCEYYGDAYREKNSEGGSVDENKNEELF